MTYDVFFLSYDEDNADENFQKIKNKCSRVKRVHGIKGIMNAHKKCADLSNTKMFYVIDADSEITNFDILSWKPDNHDRVHVWRAKNPVNGLVYGYGGLKLFPKRDFFREVEKYVDMTTTINKIGIIVMPEIATVTHFNTSPFRAWRSAFRECVKLSSKIIVNQKNDETEHRLNIWCSEGEDKKFGEYVIKGAIAGREFGNYNKDNFENLSKINDFDWLYDVFKNDARK